MTNKSFREVSAPPTGCSGVTGSRFVILAENRDDAKNLAKRRRLTRSQWIYASRPEAMEGLSNWVLIRTRNSNKHPRAKELSEQLTMLIAHGYVVSDSSNLFNK